MNVTRSVEIERHEVQGVLESVKTAMKRQNEHNQHVMGSLHAGQQRLVSDIADQNQTQSEKIRVVEQNLAKLDSRVNLNTVEMNRCMDDHISSIKRHLSSNDQAVRLVTDMMGGSLLNKSKAERDFS